MKNKDNYPQISILMAVYQPNLKWLSEQLESLNSQTYPNIRLYVRDDGSDEAVWNIIKAMIERIITAFPFEISRGNRNEGSNRTFEYLTREAEGDYFAYCDQDDIWQPEKLMVLYKSINRRRAELVCSDMYIIDSQGKRVADSITEVRKHHVFKSGSRLASGLLISNFVTGCTMLIRSDTAKDAVPFCPHMVHDQYLALCAAEKGSIISLPDRLVSYRIHEDNQTLMMAGVSDKVSYERIRIDELILRLGWLGKRFKDDPQLYEEIRLAYRWARARKRNMDGDKRAVGTMIRYSRFSPLTTLFEAVFAGAPERVFMYFIELNKSNIL